jgi:hypothetical protein
VVNLSTLPQAMSASNSQWTLETLKEHFDALFAERDKQYVERAIANKTAVEAALKAAETLNAAAFAASEKAIAKSDINAEKWREQANEWRGSMQDRENKFAARAEVDNEFKNLRSELGSLKESRAEGSGRSGGSQAMWGYVVGAIGLLGIGITFVTFLMKLGAG